MYEKGGFAIKIFVYSMRDFDEKYFYEKFCEEMGIEMDSSPDYPNLDNIELAKGCDAISIIPCKMDAEIIDKFHEIGIKYIAARSIGYDHIDIQHAHSLGMKVSNVTYSPESVADYAIMLMLMCCRNLNYIKTTANIQDYSLNGKIGREISSSTIGVIGTGRIGTTVIKHLSGFNTKILAYDPYKNKEVERYADYVDLDTLFSKCDIITLHCPATEENFHIINEENLEKMKDGVIIVNTARGSLVDESAVIKYIENGKIYGFGSDVCEAEKNLIYFNNSGKIIGDHNRAILNSFPNVMMTPHMAFYTEASVADMVKNSLVAVKSFEEGKETHFEIK